VVLVCETRKGILGYLQGYLGEAWLQFRPQLCSADGGSINWLDHQLRKIGILDICNFNNFGVIDKVVVDKTLDQKRVAFDLIKLFGKILLESEKHYMMSEVVSHIYKDDLCLDITNKASINFHKRLGFIKVGQSEKYHYEGSFLNEKGFFRDNVYMAKISALPYTYKRLYRVS
jgi:hypothetical protein